MLASFAWTKKVVAIDPGTLDPAVLSLQKVMHEQQTAEDFVSSLRQDSLAVERSFKVVTCDMNFDGRGTAAIVSQVTPLLAVGALLILTIKLPKRTTEKQVALQTAGAVSVLEQAGFIDFEVLHLLANTRCERTVFATFGSVVGK